MSANVLEWEPELALFVPDDSPLLFYRKIAELGRDMLVSGGRLYFEINQEYGRETVDMLAGLGYTFGGRKRYRYEDVEAIRTGRKGGRGGR